MNNTIKTKKTPAELQLNGGQFENYEAAGLTDNPTLLGCPAWCEHHDDTGGGMVHTVTTGRAQGKWVVEAGFDDDHEAGSRRPYVFAEIERPDEELSGDEALVMGEALVRAAQLVDTRSMEITLTGDYSSEVFALTVTAAEAALLRKLADAARDSMRSSCPITVKEV